MNTKIVIGIALAGLLVTPVALAQDTGTDENDWRGTAPSRALELTWGSGFTNAFGEVAKGRSLSDVANSGGALQLGLGYRLNPHFMIGAYGEGDFFRPEHGSLKDRRNFSAGAGVQGQYHVLPFSRWDPWVGLGTGWRGYWAVDDDIGTSVLHGVDVARVQIGVDYHMSRRLTISPTVGVSVTEFVSERQAGESSFHEVLDARRTTFLFIGTAGRFDIGGTYVDPKRAVASR